jgi:hypothetical protein
MTFTVAPLTSYTYVYIHVSHVYKLACTLYRTINLLPLFHVCPVLRHPTIVMAFHQSNAYLYRSFEKDLVDLYNIKSMGDLTWFLGIRIVRNRALHKT